jgi:hypothetical protein
VKLVELPGEVLVVQMQPVVFAQIAALDFVIVYGRVFDPGILEREGDGVVPRWSVRWRVHSDPRRFLQRDRVHVAAGDLGADRTDL